MLWDRASGLFRSTASIGFDEEALKQLTLQAGESITGKVYDDGRAVLLCTPEDVNQAMADMRPANRQVFPGLQGRIHANSGAGSPHHRGEPAVWRPGD